MNSLNYWKKKAKYVDDTPIDNINDDTSMIH